MSIQRPNVPCDNNKLSATPADWFSRGTPVADLDQRSPDAEFIIDSDFFDDEKLEPENLVWRECRIPVGEFGFESTSLSSHLAQLRDMFPADEAQRLDDIRGWISGCGGIEAALAESPLIVTIKGGQLKLEDGYHRFGLAVFEHGVQEVLALCADLDLAREHKRRKMDCAAAETPSRLTLYHGTTEESAAELCLNGWAPRSRSAGSQCGNPALLYLTNHPENALWYADQKGDVAVVEVSLDAGALRVDPDDGSHDTVAEELAGSVPGSVVAHGPIPASAFTRWVAPSKASKP